MTYFSPPQGGIYQEAIYQKNDVISDKINNHERSKDCIVFNFRLLINVSSMNINNLGAELSTT